MYLLDISNSDFSGGGDKNRNPFAMLDDEDDAAGAGNTGGGGNSGPSEPNSGGGRFSNLKSSDNRHTSSSSAAASPSRPLHRSASGGAEPKRSGGRSLADLAKRVSDRSTDNYRGSVDRGERHSRSSSAGMARNRSGSGEGLGYGNSGDHRGNNDRDRSASHGSSGGMEGIVSGAKVIRYTREKLLSLRGRGDDPLPECFKELEGAVVVSNNPQDPGKSFISFRIHTTCVYDACKLVYSSNVIKFFTPKNSMLGYI